MKLNSGIEIAAVAIGMVLLAYHIRQGFKWLALKMQDPVWRNDTAPRTGTGDTTDQNLLFGQPFSPLSGEHGHSHHESGHCAADTSTPSGSCDAGDSGGGGGDSGGGD